MSFFFRETTIHWDVTVISLILFIDLLEITISRLHKVANDPFRTIFYKKFHFIDPFNFVD